MDNGNNSLLVWGKSRGRRYMLSLSTVLYIQSTKLLLWGASPQLSEQGK